MTVLDEIAVERRPQAYRTLIDRFEHPAGTVVYKTVLYDYGLANDDTRGTGIPHVTVTLDPAGGYPGFTIPKDALEPIDRARATPEETTP